MAMMAWKQNLGEGNVGPERAQELLRTFRYPTELDKKGRLRIDIGLSKLVLGFQPNGANSTLIGVSQAKMNPVALVLFIVFLLAFVVPGFIFAMIVSGKRKKVFFEAVQTMNQAIMLKGPPRTES